MPSRSERSAGAFSQATRSLLNASRFSFVSSRKSSSRSSMPHSPRLQGQGFGPALVNLGLRPPGREVRAEQQNPFLGFRHLDRSAGFLHQRSEEHTSELQSLMRISYAVFCLKKKTHKES